MILSLMVTAVISNPMDDQVADNRTIGCAWYISFRSECSNNYASKFDVPLQVLKKQIKQTISSLRQLRARATSTAPAPTEFAFPTLL